MGEGVFPQPLPIQVHPLGGMKPGGGMVGTHAGDMIGEIALAIDISSGHRTTVRGERQYSRSFLLAIVFSPISTRQLSVFMSLC